MKKSYAEKYMTENWAKILNLKNNKFHRYLPDIFISCGDSYFLDEECESSALFLSEKNISPSPEVCSFRCEYIHPKSSNFSEIKRLYMMIEKNSDYTEDFKGIIIIDVTEWLSHENEYYFKMFFSFVADLKNRLIFAAECDENQAKHFLYSLNNMIRLEHIAIPNLTENNLLDSISSSIKRVGIPLEPAEFENIRKILRERGIKTYRQATLLGNELIYEWLLDSVHLKNL